MDFFYMECRKKFMEVQEKTICVLQELNQNIMFS